MIKFSSIFNVQILSHSHPYTEIRSLFGERGRSYPFCKICTNECKKIFTFLYTCILIQLAVSTASGNEESVTTPVYLAILKGLERLLLTDVLSQQDSDTIVKLGVDR